MSNHPDIARRIRQLGFFPLPEGHEPRWDALLLTLDHERNLLAEYGWDALYNYYVRSPEWP